MKTIFLDIDGTLVADKGTVPESAVQAIKQAQKNNHKIVLCTGRAMPEIYQPILDIGFDGIVACGGNYVECNGEILYDRSFTHDELKELYPSITSGYHMNKKHWISIFEGQNIDADFIEDMVKSSYALVVSKLNKTQKMRIKLLSSK